MILFKPWIGLVKTSQTIGRLTAITPKYNLTYLSKKEMSSKFPITIGLQERSVLSPYIYFGRG